MQVAALWALRNFALVEAHRQRMTAMRVIDQSLALLSSTSAPPGVKHAAAALLQTLSTAARHRACADGGRRAAEARRLPLRPPQVRCVPLVLPDWRAVADYDEGV